MQIKLVEVTESSLNLPLWATWHHFVVQVSSPYAYLQVEAGNITRINFGNNYHSII